MKKQLRFVVALALAVGTLQVASEQAQADTDIVECGTASSNNCFEAPLFNYAHDDVDDFLLNPSICLRGAFGTRLGGNTLGVSLYANSCSSGIQDLAAASTPVTADDLVKIVLRTDFKPDITRGNADFQSSDISHPNPNKWITTIIAKPINDFMMGLGADCQPLVTDEPTIVGYTHGCPNTDANRVASALIDSKLTVLLADWTAMEGGTPNGPPPELKGLIMGFNGTDLVWRPDTVLGGFKFWVAGPHFYPDYVDGVLQNVENNLGFFSVFIPKAAVQLFTNLTPAKQQNPETVQSNLEVTYQDLNGLADASPDTAGAMIEACIAKGGEVDVDAKKCMKDGVEISLRSLGAQAFAAPLAALPLGYTITEDDTGWWVRSEHFGFSAPKIVAKKRIANFKSSSVNATASRRTVNLRWSRATLSTVFGPLAANLYRIRVSQSSAFPRELADEVITNKLSRTLRNLEPGRWWISVAPILNKSGTGLGQETKTSVVVRGSTG